MLPQWSNIRKPVIGMLHLPPLPGSPNYRGDLSAIREHVLRDADALVSGGAQGLMLENFGDMPFFPQRVPALTVAHMAALALDVRRRFDVPLGINVLRNDGRGALAIAHAVGAEFIRVNILCGARVTDQGLIQGIAHDLLRDRALLGATRIRILADVDVKHSAPLAAIPLEDEARDALERGGADGLIVSGSGTGRPADVGKLERVKAVAGKSPVFVGSGVTAETIPSLLPFADGFIVGTSLKRDGVPSHPVDPARVRELMSRL